MSSAPWTKPLRHAVWAAALAVAVAGIAGNAWAQQSPAPAQAQDDDDIEDHVLNADKRLLNSILGPLGLAAPPGAGIEYRERSPLVVPRGRDLPAPGKAVKGGDWPLEPEVKAKREANALRKAGKDPDAKARMSSRQDEKPISGTGEQWKTGNTGSWTDNPKYEEPGFFSMLFKGQLSGSWTETGKFDGEPPRATLSDPPPGYLTPSAAAPYGVTPYKGGTPEKKEKPL
jgi:hypothetical protein